MSTTTNECILKKNPPLLIAQNTQHKLGNVTSVNLKKAGMASQNIPIKHNTRCFKSALQYSLDFSFLFLFLVSCLPEKHKFSGTNQKPERRRPFGTGLVRHCPQGLFSPFFTFLRALFFRPFRLSLAPLSAPGSPRMPCDSNNRICYSD